MQTRQFNRHLELVLADVLLDIVQLLHSIAAPLFDSLAVLGDSIQVALHHALHTQPLAWIKLCSSAKN